MVEKQGTAQARASKPVSTSTSRHLSPGRTANKVAIKGNVVTAGVVSKTGRTAQRSTTSARPTSARPRSSPADDPLAPERTRWLADAVGGLGRLAQMLGVSASQTSRWSRGEERPGIDAAPLLIDLEHVIARVRLVFAEPAAGVWMTSANTYLEGARPLDVLALSGPGPVLEALDAQTWGSAA